MGEQPPRTELAPWQREFVRSYLGNQQKRSILIANTGTGKITAALSLSKHLLGSGSADSVMVVAGLTAMDEQWRKAAGNREVELAIFIAETVLDGGTLEENFFADARSRRWFIIVDEPFAGRPPIDTFVDRVLDSNRASKALYLSRSALGQSPFDEEFRFNTEYVSDPTTLAIPDTEIRIAQYSPSFSMLRKIEQSGVGLDDLSWREFERLVANLLEFEGYDVQLMQGSKDGGVDIVAVKNVGSAGSFKTLWQAKRKRVSNKVGISIVRELADTRLEFGASKALIVTSSYLTRGALQRVERDRYILGKVDRDDLDSWIRRVLFNPRS
jgi:hypothetical protein